MSISIDITPLLKAIVLGANPWHVPFRSFVFLSFFLFFVCVHSFVTASGCLFSLSFLLFLSSSYVYPACASVHRIWFEECSVFRLLCLRSINIGTRIRSHFPSLSLSLILNKHSRLLMDHRYQSSEKIYKGLHEISLTLQVIIDHCCRTAGT